MSYVISCRPGVYGDFERALELLPDAGITHVEIDNASADDLADRNTIVQKHGLTAATAATNVNISEREAVEQYLRFMQTAVDAGIPKIFTSIKGDIEEPVDSLMSRLRDICAEAGKLSILITMETHPPFAQNADNALEVMETVDSPALLMNFDTANIHYYSEEATDSVLELKKVVHKTGSVHLKDTQGGYHSAEFPVIGQGVVDFPEVFRICGNAGLTGPFTLELEGPVVKETEKRPEARHELVKASMDYLRTIGAA